MAFAARFNALTGIKGIVTVILFLMVLVLVSVSMPLRALKGLLPLNGDGSVTFEIQRFNALTGIKGIVTLLWVTEAISNTKGFQCPYGH